MTDLSYDIHRQGIVIDGNPPKDELDHAGKLIVHHQLPVVHGDPGFRIAETVNNVGPCQRRQQCGEGLFMAGLRIRDLVVALPTGDLTGQFIIARHLGYTCINHGGFRISHYGGSES